MNDYKVIGYYICEITDMPKYLHALGTKMLSVSTCLGELHPRRECFLGGWHKGESLAYQKSLMLDDKQYQEFLETAGRLFDSGKLEVDGRFLHLSDAQYFYKKIPKTLPCCLVSISTTSAYLEILAEELKGGNCQGWEGVNGEIDSSVPIGSDILGWDIGGFHSFLCNSLHKSISEAKFNEIGLLENDFDEVIRFARRIEGKGEPVEWIPCKVGEPLSLLEANS